MYMTADKHVPMCTCDRTRLQYESLFIHIIGHVHIHTVQNVERSHAIYTHTHTHTPSRHTASNPTLITTN